MMQIITAMTEVLLGDICVLQVFAFTAKKELMIDELCIDTSYRNPLVLQRCHGQGGSQRWLFDKKVPGAVDRCRYLKIIGKEFPDLL